MEETDMPYTISAPYLVYIYGVNVSTIILKVSIVSEKKVISPDKNK